MHPLFGSWLERPDPAQSYPGRTKNVVQQLLSQHFNRGIFDARSQPHACNAADWDSERLWTNTTQSARDRLDMFC